MYTKQEDPQAMCVAAVFASLAGQADECQLLAVGQLAERRSFRGHRRSGARDVLLALPDAPEAAEVVL